MGTSAHLSVRPFLSTPLLCGVELGLTPTAVCLLAREVSHPPRGAGGIQEGGV